MNKQKDAVQEAVEALDKLELDPAKGYFTEDDLLELYDIIRTALKSSPVDVDELRQGINGYSHNMEERNVFYMTGWNDCLDHLSKNGYRITKEG